MDVAVGGGDLVFRLRTLQNLCWRNPTMTMRLFVTGVMLCGVCAVGAAGLQARQAPPDALGAANAGFAEVSGWLSKSAELIPADKYTYKPIGTVRSVGEMLAHAADGMQWYCGMAAGRKVEWSDATEKGRTDKATITAALKKATDGCGTVYGHANSRIDQLFANIAHANLHYGNLVTYMRMLGLTPPSS
jgi:uncharacterized damage-inducible protein DinB